MNGRLVVVTGTGTGIGKTHVAAALVGAWRSLFGAHAAVVGVKPIESGVPAGAEGDDGAALGRMSTFHVKRFHPPYLLARPVSPHLAAREEGRPIEAAVVVTAIAALRSEVDALVVELAGGLFSPLGPGLSNAHVAKALGADAVILVAPDRLGVLHEVGATARAARAEGIVLSGLILNAPEHPDASTSTNAAELGLVCDVPLVACVPRAPAEELARRKDLRAFLSGLP